MDLTSREEVKSILEKHHITLAKTYGQHFLVDRKILEKIVFPTDVGRPKRRTDDVCVEVGPGIGTLTRELADHFFSVIAIERDPRFLPVLAETLEDKKNVKIVENDALKVSFTELIKSEVTANYPLPTTYSIISNLPYEITTPFLWKILFEEQCRPERVVLLLQKDVVDRIFASSPHRSILGLLVGLSGDARRVCPVPQSAFFPPPRVESTVIAIENIAEQMSVTDRHILKLAKKAFAAPRKKLSSTIGDAAGVFKDRRPGELSVQEWRKICAAEIVPRPSGGGANSA